MRQGPNNRRGGQRRPHPSGNGGGHTHHRGGEQPARRSAASLRNQSFDSNGPDVRVRGNAWQVHEKYLSLAREAQMAGDRVAAENLLQHAEHYYRIIEAINEASAAEQAARGYTPGGASQPDARGLYPAVQGAAAGVGPTTEAPPIGADVIRTPRHPSPFFAPEEDETKDDIPARVAGF